MHCIACASHAPRCEASSQSEAFNIVRPSKGTVQDPLFVGSSLGRIVPCLPVRESEGGATRAQLRRNLKSKLVLQN